VIQRSVAPSIRRTVKRFLFGLRETGCLNVMPTADALPRLRILEHCVLLVNLMLRLEVVRVGGGPVAIQSCSKSPGFPSQSSPPA